MQPPAGESARALVPLPVLRGVAIVVLAASVIAGVGALRDDLALAFRDAGPSVFAPSVRRQIEAVRREVPAGARILLVSASQTYGSWYTRLYQRALYPRNEVIVRYLPLARADTADLRQRWRIRYGLVLGTEPADQAFATVEDLGPLPAQLDRVWLGELAP